MNKLVLHLKNLTEEQAQWLEDTFLRIEDAVSGITVPEPEDEGIVNQWATTTEFRRNQPGDVTISADCDESGIFALLEVLAVFVTEVYGQSLMIQWQTEDQSSTMPLGGGAAYITRTGKVHRHSTMGWLADMHYADHLSFAH